MYKWELEMRRYCMLEVWGGWGRGATGSRARGGRACSVFLLTAFITTTSLTPCS